MTKRAQSKHKIARSLVENLWGQEKSPINQNRNYGPGMHGQKRKKISDYGVQLRAKQKLKKYYGDITEKQFKRLFDEAVRLKGDTVENLIGLLERRLTTVIYRMKVVPTVFAARQVINHGHVRVNDKKVDIPSALIKAGDSIEIDTKMSKTPLFMLAQKSEERSVPDYIISDNKGLKATFNNTPKFTDVPYPVKMEPNLVVEFYSR